MQRISQSMMSQVFLQDMHGSLKRLMDIEKQLASQKLYEKPSDNPSEVARGMTVGTSLARNEQYQKNLDDAASWLSSTDTALNQITDIISAIREKVIYSCDGSLSRSDREAIAEDIEALRDELVQTANFDVEGRYLLSGLDTSTPAYSKSDDGTVIYQGDDGRIQFQVEKGETGLVSLNGLDVFPLDYVRHSVTSIELPLDFRWTGSSENLQITVGDRTVQVAVPQRWSDDNQDSLSDLSDYDGFISAGESLDGYTLQEIAELLNSSEGAGYLVHASVETDSLSGTQRLNISSLTGEQLQITSIIEAKTVNTGQRLSSDPVAPGWTASADGEISIDFGSGEPVSISVAAGDSLEDIALSLSMIEGLWAGARGDGTIALIGEDLTEIFSASASGGAAELFGSTASSKAVEISPDISHLGLSSYLGLETYAVSTQLEPSAIIGDTTVEPLEIAFSSGERKLKLVIGDDSTLTLEDLAQRLKAAAGDWIEVVLESDQPVTNLTDGSSGNAENGTQRLMLRTKDGSPLAIYDMNGSYAKNLGLESALTTSDLSAVKFPDTASSDVPAFIGVEIGGNLYRVKLYQEDIASSDGASIDPQALARQIRLQVGEDLIGAESVQAGGRIALYSVTGEPLRIMDLPYSDPSLEGLTSGLAMAAGLQAGVTSDWVDQDLAAGSESSFTICTGGRSLTVSVASSETIGDAASRITELAGGWIDVSVASDGTGNMRLALAAKDGSPLNIYDVTGTAARDFKFNTEVRLQTGTWTDGGELKISVDGYELVMDLEGETTLHGVADQINMRFCGGDIKACIVDNGGVDELILYSPDGKSFTVEPPASMNMPNGDSSPARSAGGGGGPSAQTVTVRRGADVETADMFAILEDVIAAVRQGDTEGLSLSFLPKLDQGIDDVLRARAFCGAIQRRYDISQSRLESNNIAMTDLQSSIMDVDIAEASIEFQTAQTVYQATLATISKVIQPTLVDYLS